MKKHHFPVDHHKYDSSYSIWNRTSYFPQTFSKTSYKRHAKRPAMLNSFHIITSTLYIFWARVVQDVDSDRLDDAAGRLKSSHLRHHQVEMDQQIAQIAPKKCTKSRLPMISRIGLVKDFSHFLTGSLPLSSLKKTTVMILSGGDSSDGFFISYLLL